MPNPSTSDLHHTTLQGTRTQRSSGESSPSIALTIAYHPQLERIGDRLVLPQSADKPLALSRVKPDFLAPGAEDGEPLHDAFISRSPIHFTAHADGGVELDVGEGKTTVIVAGHEVTDRLQMSAEDVARGVVLTVGKRVVLLLHSVPTLDAVLGALDPNVAPELIGTSVGLRKVLLDIKNVATTKKSVLIRGETGSGKELVARAIHRASGRRDKPYVAANMAAISPELSIAALFGAKKGSFSGSIERITGFFEHADTGTLFLDEIGASPVKTQEPLLRALQEGEIQTIGMPRPQHVDVRVISATDADLEHKVESGAFSPALLNRLAGFRVDIPPLRERRDDIGILLVRFLQDELAAINESARLQVASDDAKPWLPASIVAQLIDYDWPGNVRELKNVVGQIVVSNQGRERVELPMALERQLAKRIAPVPVVPAPSPAPVLAPLPRPAPAGPDGGKKPRKPSTTKPAEITENHLREALRECRWELQATADALGISRPALYTLKARFPWFRFAADLKVEEIQQCHSDCSGQLRQMSERLEVSEQALKRRIRELGLKLGS